MPKPSKKELKALNDIAQSASERFQRESAMQFGECAINLMATCMPLSSVTGWLRRQADILDEYG